MTEYSHSSSAEKVLDILTLFGENGPHLSIEDIQDRLAIPQSTTYRYLRLLCDKGFLHKAQESTYQLGRTFHKLSQVSFDANRDLRFIARPGMERIVTEVGESVFLMRLYDKEAVCIEAVEVQHALRVIIELGISRKLHAGASSKVILAHLPEKEWEKRLEFPLESYTETTLTELEELLDELHQIRQRGYALSDGEVNSGVRAVAVPVLNKHGRVIAALSIEGPMSRMSNNLITRSVELLLTEAQSIQDKPH